jgi:cytochrome c biogenesis protein CcdA
MLTKIPTFLFKLSDMKWHHSVFIYGLYLSYFLFFIAFTGIVSFSPNYLYMLRLIINYYIIFILLIRYNPFISKTNVKVDSAFDRRLVFSAACFMLISSSLFDYVDNYIHIRS